MRDEKLLDTAEAHINSGRIEAAISALESAVDRDPDWGEAHQMLGGLYAHVERYADAARHLEKAATLDAGDVRAVLNLAATYVKMGRTADALAPARAAAQLAPNVPMVWSQLAAVLEANDIKQEALTAVDRLIELDGIRPTSLVRKIRILLALGSGAAAADLMRQWLHILDAAALTKAAGLAKSLHDPMLTFQVTQAWTQKAVTDSAAWEAHSESAMAVGDVVAAQKAYARFMELAGQSPERLVAYARISLGAQDFDAAEKALAHAIENGAATRAEAFALARFYTFKGQLEEAEEQCRRAIELNPEHSAAYAQLVNVRRGRVETDVREKMIALWDGSEKGQPETRAQLGLSIGDIFAREGDVDTAFRYFEKANAVTKALYSAEGCAYDAAAHDRLIEDLMTEGWALDQVPPFEPVGFRPIFIVGMPRSGTTVTETILAAHSTAHGVGEGQIGGVVFQAYRQYMGQNGRTLKGYVASQGEALRDAFTKAYAARGDRQVVVDKLPVNFLNVGLLAHLFPEARFVYSVRNPIETGFSIFRHAFPKSYPFACDLEAIAHYSKACSRLMAHWRACLEAAGQGHRLVHFENEALIADPESAVRNLLQQMDMAFEEQCLNFHEARRAVATFSAVQVRAPASKDFLGKAAPFAAHLKPLKDAFSR